METPPNWYLFQSFLAVIREGSLSGAARVLGMTQPTLGRQVAALEQQLHVRLFTRSHEGLAPTDVARRLVDSIEAMAAAAQAAQRLATGLAGEEGGTVRITASEIMGTEVLPAIFARIRTQHPRIALELALTNRNEDLLRREADIAVRMQRPTQGTLVARRIGRIDVGLYAHRQYLKTHGTPRRLEDLAQHALIAYDREQRYAKLLEQMGLPLTRAAFAFRSDSDLAQLAALRSGLGIGLCQWGIARRDGNLVSVLPAKFRFPMDTWLAMHQDLRSSGPIRRVFDALAAELSAYAGESSSAA